MQQPTNALASREAAEHLAEARQKALIEQRRRELVSLALEDDGEPWIAGTRRAPAPSRWSPPFALLVIGAISLGIAFAFVWRALGL